MKLYNIGKEYIDLADELEASGGELTPELEARLEINEANLETKVINYGFVVLGKEAEVAMIDMEIKRLQQLKEKRVNIGDGLMERIKKAMELFGKTEVGNHLIKINFRKSKYVDVPNTDDLDVRFLNYKEVITADKVAIKKAIEAGEVVAGASIKENKNLQIK